MKNKMKDEILKICCILGFVTFPFILSAQLSKSDNIKPQWFHNTLTPSNPTFIYDVVPANAKSLKEARDLSISALILEAGLEGGQTVQSNVESYEFGEQTLENNKENVKSIATIKIESTLKGKPAVLTAKKIDEYWERGEDGTYHLTTLYARSQVDVVPNFDDVKLTTKYGIEDMWRSVIVPGWGQLYKGSTLKGGLIMGGTVACIGAIIYTDCTRASFNSKINKTHDAKLKLHYADQRTAYTTGRNICIGALCALYVYNIVDAIVAPGARRILTSPAGSNNFSYYWSPTLTDDLGVGVVASISF